MEDGTITLVGATTENPSFELNGALLSRALVLVFHRLDEAALEELLARAEAEEGRSLPLDAEARETLKAMADGDGRTLLNMAEELFGSLAAGTAPLDRDALTELVQRRAPLYDKSRDGHYNLISALHKAVRGSDPDAALYWLARMLDGGEDRLYVARRLVRMAIEDIGLADPQALVQALAAKDASIFWARPKASWRWRRPSSTWRPRPSPMPPTPPSARPCARPRSTAAWRRPSTSSMRRRADEGGGLRQRLRVRPLDG